jgi:hypothetical protein
MLNKYSFKNILLLIISFSMSYLMAQEKIVFYNVNVIDGLNSTVQKIRWYLSQMERLSQ